MSVINATPLLAAAGGDYQISRSVRLRSSASAYFNRTPASTTNQKTWTFSCWMKRGTLGTNGMSLISAGTASNNGTSFYFSSDQLIINNIIGGGSQGAAYTPAVLRDPSAWYHIVLSMDTTQTSFANGWAKIFINGVQQTLTQAAAPTQNSNTFMNLSTNAMWIARDIINANYFDGYLTEVNFIDGQALTPSSFGETDSITGVWKPKKYAGTYGTNGFYLPFSISSTSSFAGSFNGSSQSLSAPANAALSFGSGNFTLEAWVLPSTSSGTRPIFESRASSASSAGYAFGVNGSNQLFVFSGGGFAGTSSAALTTGVWSHVALVRNGTTATFYINGVASGSFTFSNNITDPTSNITRIGASTTAGELWNGFLTNARIVVGTAVYTGAFTPSAAPLAAITNTQLLTLQNSTIVDNSANAFTITNTGAVATSVVFPFTTNISADYSGNNNNWTPNNISLANNATYDSMLDVPTLWADGGNGRGNYATLNPLFNPGSSSFVISNGNLRLTQSGAATTSLQGTIGVNSGSWYYEVTFTTNSGDAFIGLAATEGSIGSASTPANAAYRRDGLIFNGSTWVSYGASYTSGDVIGVAYDAGASTITFYKNGASQGQKTITYTGLLFPSIYSGVSGNVFDANFGQRPFAYTPPTGFKALNTQNLPEPTIKKGNQYFDATTYTGNGTTQSIVNSGGMQPDLVWAKNRATTTWNSLQDVIRGATKELYSNATDAEATYTNTLTSFNSNGFSVGNAAAWNGSGNGIVAWQWKESPSAGFDIVTYTGTGANRTVAHSLGVAPSMMIVKNRTTAGEWWHVYHQSLGATKAVFLNSTNAAGTSIDWWNNTAPTSSVFTVNTSGAVNGSGASLVAYLFAEVAGFSKFGSYVGNGSSTDGPFVFTGFRPRYVMVKRTDTTGNWYVLDTARNSFNLANAMLAPNLSAAEFTSTEFNEDMLSNGFKLRTANVESNASGGTYIFMAFAESPFKTSLAR